MWWPGAAIPAVSIRFPVGFRDACNVGGSVGFASFALWLGALRERGTGPISKQIVEDMATGRWGMVTNNSEVFIDANLYTDDIVEGTIWITELTGPDRATTNLHVEWSRVDGETRTHIGWSAMQTTWVEILSHGVVAARPMPQYFHDFIEPDDDSRRGRKNIAVPTEPKNVDRGSVIRSAPMVPRNPYLLEIRGVLDDVAGRKRRGQHLLRQLLHLAVEGSGQVPGPFSA